jgi:hypothetical protein
MAMMGSRTNLLAGILTMGALFVPTSAMAGKTVALSKAPAAPPESSLIDVRIHVLEPAKDFLPQVRRAEARYIPYELKRVLEAAGFWGAVRVVRDGDDGDLTISGVVAHSHGQRLELEITATDSTGKVWLDKKYNGRANPSVYLDPESTFDPFQNVYHRIANDLSKKYRKLKSTDIERIRTVSRLRFASALAPEVFAEYLSVEKSRYTAVRLPAHDDPMMERVARIRQRDGMFVDTVDAYYGSLFERMQEPYLGWRSQDYWQREAMKNGPPTAQRSGGRNAPWGVLGGGGRGRQPVSIPGGLCPNPVDYGHGRRSTSEDDRRWQEERRRTHLDILRELGESLAADVEPLVIEVDGKVAELTGSVEVQYAKWRSLMREIFVSETGGPSVISQQIQ